MLRGPIEYVPPASVEVLLRRQAIPLDENEGIYVRDIKTGKVGVASAFPAPPLYIVLYLAERCSQVTRYWRDEHSSS